MEETDLIPGLLYYVAGETMQYDRKRGTEFLFTTRCTNCEKWHGRTYATRTLRHVTPVSPEEIVNEKESRRFERFGG